MLKEKLYDLFCNMDDEELVCIWNNYCSETYMFDDEIYTADGLEEIMKTYNYEDPFYWVNRFFYGYDEYSENGSANPNRNYFIFNGYGNIVSFDYIYNQYKYEFSHIDIDSLIDYIIENKDSLYNTDIEDILNEEEDEEE